MKRPYSTVDDKKIMIIGGTGSLGQTLIRRFMKERFNNTVMVVSRDEAKHWTIKNEYKEDPRANHLRFAVGDIRDQARVTQLLKSFQPNIVIMAAALKQVDTCEMAPEESIKTNLLGIQSVLDAVQSFDNPDWLQSVLLVSTDKASEPINVYGMCKAISERLTTSRDNDYSRIKHIAVRYGNVLESRGSILPLFKWQAENADCFTVTHKDMTRFIMTLDESVNLIESAVGPRCPGGNIMIPKLDSMKIYDLAEIFSEIHGKKIKITGIRPGEKMHESLIGESESWRAIEHEDYYLVASALSPISKKAKSFTYTSGQSQLTKEQLRNRLESLGIFKMTSKDFVGRKIEEIVSIGDKQ